METISQFIPQAFVNILISVICWILFSITVLSLPAMLTGGGFLTPDLPITRSIFYGFLVGIAHGLLTTLLTYKQQSTFRIFISSVVVTEILLAVGFVTGFIINYFNRPIRSGSFRISMTLENIGLLIVTGIFWFAVLSALFFIPSAIIGLLGKVFLLSAKTQ
jgi:hypothetical protein